MRSQQRAGCLDGVQAVLRSPVAHQLARGMGRYAVSAFPLREVQREAGQDWACGALGEVIAALDTVGADLVPSGHPVEMAGL